MKNILYCWGYHFAVLTLAEYATSTEKIDLHITSILRYVQH